MFSQNSEKLIFKRKWWRNVAKTSEKRPKEVEKRGNLIEKQKAHEKIGKL
jgi:hypothetical protein